MVHDGRPEDIGYSYRMIYPSVGLVSELARELTGGAPRGTPTFRNIIERDVELSHAFTRAHQALEQPQAALGSRCADDGCDGPHFDALQPDLRS
jgi:hypothetical protein